MILIAMYFNFSYNSQENTVEITSPSGKVFSRTNSEKINMSDGRRTLGSEESERSVSDVYSFKTQNSKLVRNLDSVRNS